MTSHICDRRIESGKADSLRSGLTLAVGGGVGLLGRGLLDIMERFCSAPAEGRRAGVARSGETPVFVLF